MLCVMMLPLVVVVDYIKAVCQSVREATTASGVDNAASPRLADTAERDYFTLREADHYAKNNWKNSILMSSADRLPISMGNSCNVSTIHALPAEYKY